MEEVKRTFSAAFKAKVTWKMLLHGQTLKELARFAPYGPVIA